MRILVSGSSGFIGSHLFSFLKAAGHTVISLTRKPGIQDSIFWDPQSGKASIDSFEGFDTIIHLAGKNISSGLWTEKFKRELFQSRCRDTWFLSQILTRLKNPPKTLICASAVGFYGNRGDEVLTENSLPGKGFLADLTQKWEEATKGVEERGIRRVNTRFGIVLSPNGGILKKLLPLFRLGLGAIIGSGKEWISWITLEDLIGGIDHVLHNNNIQGPVNFCSPNPVSSKEFAKSLAKAINRPCFLRVSPKLLKLIFGEMAEEMFLSSVKALPTVLEQSGYIFKYPSLEETMQHFF